MPLSFEIPLAELLDRLSEAGSATVDEGGELSVSGLAANDAAAICAIVQERWALTIEDSAGNLAAVHQLEADFEPFRIVLQKPAAGAGRSRLLTLVGFQQTLNRPDIPEIIEHARCSAAFATFGLQVVGWDEPVVAFEIAEQTRSPRDLVRETSHARVVPDDVRPWLLRSEAPQNGDPLFETWASSATINLARSLVSEVLPDGRLVLRGVIRMQITGPSKASYDALGREGFAGLQQAAQWVYANAREAETRLGLLLNELTRSAAYNGSFAETFRACSDALEGARLAFQLGLEGLSKDTMKALADLRKSLSDETAKLSDITRQLAVAVAGSVFLGMGVILTKQSSNISFMGVLFLGLVLALYVAFVGFSGHQYVVLQRDLRSEWRKILYRFVSNDEYQRMVLTPATKAEENFYDACWIAGIALAMLFAAMCFMFS